MDDTKSEARDVRKGVESTKKQRGKKKKSQKTKVTEVEEKDADKMSLDSKSSSETGSKNSETTKDTETVAEKKMSEKKEQAKDTDYNEQEDLVNSDVRNVRARDLESELEMHKAIKEKLTESIAQLPKELPTQGVSSMLYFDTKWDMTWMLRIGMSKINNFDREVFLSERDMAAYTTYRCRLPLVSDNLEYEKLRWQEILMYLKEMIKIQLKIETGVMIFGDRQNPVPTEINSRDGIRSTLTKIHGYDLLLADANYRIVTTNRLSSIDQHAMAKLPSGKQVVLRKATFRDQVSVFNSHPTLKLFITDPESGYRRYSSLNRIKGLYTDSFDRSKVVSVKNLVMMPANITASMSEEYEYLATHIPNFPITMFKIIYTLIETYVFISAGEAMVNSQQISQTFATNLMVVSSLNQLSSEAFSANSRDIFKVMCAASVMHKHFSYVYRPENNCFSSGTMNSIFAYLIYTPAYILDPQSVEMCKLWLYEHAVSNFIQTAEVKEISIWVSATNQSEGNMRVLPTQQGFWEAGKRIGLKFHNFDDMMQWMSDKTSAIADFFNFDFIDTTDGPFRLNMRTGTAGIDVIINFLTGLQALRADKSTFSSAQINSFSTVCANLKNQSTFFHQYAKYMRLVINELKGLQLQDFRSPIMRVDLTLNPSKLFSLTTNLNHFNAEFNVLYPELGLWLSAFRLDVITINRFVMLLYDINQPYVYSFPGASALTEYLKPLLEKVNEFTSTNLSRIFLKELIQGMKKEEIPKGAFVNKNDILQIRELSDICNDMFQKYWDRYHVKTIYVNGIMNAKARSDMQYISFVDDGCKFINLSLDEYFKSPLPHGAFSVTADWKKFRLKPVERKTNDDPLPDFMAVLKELRSNRGVIEIPIYFRWKTSFGGELDPIHLRPPMFMVKEADVSTDFLRSIKIDNCLDEQLTVDYYNHDLDDILITKSDDISKLYTLTKNPNAL